MAYSIMKIDCSNHSNRIEYLCDKMSDVENLPTSSKNGKDLNSDNITNQPCAISSVALCIENSSRYILGNDNIWHKLTNVSSDVQVDFIDGGIF